MRVLEFHIGNPIRGNMPWSQVPSLSMLGILLALTAATGCSDSANIATVTGTITVDGTPVGPGTIMFDPVPSDGPMGPSAIGHFRTDGMYTLMLPGGKEGAYVGEYRVMILSRDITKFGDEEMPSSKGASRIHIRYQDIKHSGLTATVEPGVNEIDFNLDP